MLAYIRYPDWIKPEIFPGLPIRWYGLMYLIAFAIAYILFRVQIKEQKLPIAKEETTSYFFWGIVGLLIGARIFGAFVYDPSGRYLRNPLLVFWPFDEQFRFVGLAGMSYHGGVIGCVVALLIYCRTKKVSFLLRGDLLAAGIPLGYTFGRLGNFLNAELYGRVTASPVGMLFPHAEPFSVKLEWVKGIAQKAGIAIGDSEVVNLPRHASQLYEGFFEGIVLWLVIWFIFRKRKPFDGFLIGVYIIGYGLIRFVIEYFREPDIGIGFPLRFGPADNPNALLLSPWNFTTGQILCMFMVFGGIIFLIILRKRNMRLKELPVATKKNYRKIRKKIK